MLSKSLFSIFFLCFIFLAACQPATAAIPDPTVSLPTDTPTSLPPTVTPTLFPSATITPTPVPSDTPLPTESPTEVPTPSPSDLFGIWQRVTDEHGNEYLFFGEENLFVYAEGRVENVTEAPSFTGSYLLERGILSLQTEDCLEVMGTYTIRLLAGKYLNFDMIEDACEGRGDDLTFKAWQRYGE